MGGSCERFNQELSPDNFLSTPGEQKSQQADVYPSGNKAKRAYELRKLSKLSEK